MNQAAPYITPVYAAILGMLFVFLSVRALRLRRSLNIPIGDEGNRGMARAMRVHSNFAEYAPFTLLLIFMLEFAGGRPWLVHVLCLCLLAGRVVHAFGVSREPENFSYRVFGMAMTFTALIGACGLLLATYLLSLTTSGS